MTKKPTVDGFIPRRSQGPIGEHHQEVDRKLPRPVMPRPIELGSHHDPRYRSAREISTSSQHPPLSAQPSGTAGTPVSPLQRHGLTRADVDDSLRQIDDAPEQESSKKRRRRKQGDVPSRRRKIIKRVILALFIIAVAVGVWLGVKALIASGSVLKGNIFDLVQAAPLKQDANGLSNVLVFGTSEDDPGHDGALLTDSIMVVSINQTKKNAHTVSIPRDLYVEFGEACNSGYQGKINELYNCFSDGGKEPEAGARALASKVSEVTGLEIQYHAQLNYTVVRQAVDAVGGVDVDVMGNGPVPYGVKEGSILDRNFDWKCNHKCYYVKYEPGVHHMDGEHALAFMRARNAQGGYGLADNFDREKNQQKVIVALRNKATSVGTLANPGKVTGLIDALGDNLKTNFETKEIRTLMSLGTDIKGESIKSIALNDEKEPQMTTGTAGGMSIVQPVLGVHEYSGIASYIKKQITADPAVLEGASIVVLNGSGVAGAGQAAADKLDEMGFSIVSVGNAPAGTYQRREVYQKTADAMPHTAAKLKGLYGELRTGVEKFGVGPSVDFVVIVGQAGQADAQ